MTRRPIPAPVPFGGPAVPVRSYAPARSADLRNLDEVTRFLAGQSEAVGSPETDADPDDDLATFEVLRGF